MQLPINLYPTTPATFEQDFLSALQDLRADGIGGLIFGNIHLADVRAWYEGRVRAAQLEHVEPLWGEAPSSIVREVLARGYSTILTCTEDATTDPDWLGRPLSEELIAAFEARGIDPCGERGEYHTLVTDGPTFRAPIDVRLGGIHIHSDPQVGARFRQLDVHLISDA